jgi:uncharacterized protein YjbJ (UPF0337 family)
MAGGVAGDNVPAERRCRSNLVTGHGGHMGTRIDETVGNVKQTVGDVIDDEQMEREGQAEADRAKLQRETDGLIDKGVGKAQETWGNLTDDAETEAKGIARQIEGDAKRAG